MRRGSASIVANPVLVGAVTTLVIVVAVFLAYNANNGLPFVPTRQYLVQLTNGAELVKGNEVREGGFRVGVIDEMKPTRIAGNRVGALLRVKLDESAGALPADTHFVVRMRSALGLKYLEIDRGHSKKTIPDGGTVSVRQTTVPVDLDQVYSMFDKRTRDASAEDLHGFGDTFAGRGQDLNDLIQVLPRLTKVLAPVARNLSDRSTDLAGFFDALDRTVRVVAPVSRVYAHGFTTQADTWAAIDHDPNALKATITKNVPTLEVSTRSLAVQRPFLADTAIFSRDLASAARELPATLPVVNDALRIGTPVQRRSVAMDQELQQALEALRDLAATPTTNASLRGLTATVATLQPQLRFLGPYVTVCNDWNMFWTFTAEHFTAQTNTGTAERAQLDQQGNQDNGLGNMESPLPAAGLNTAPPQGQPGAPTPQYLHISNYPDALGPSGAADCEAGQQGYIRGANTFTQLKDPHYQRVVNDPPHGGNPLQGPTYQTFDANGHGHGLNPDHVPAGETWTWQPGGAGALYPIPRP